MPAPKILIVDDEPLNVDYQQQELEGPEFETLTAANGTEALERVQSARPDLILLDIMMPLMDGFEVLTRLKADAVSRSIPVIVISAATDMASVVRGIRLGSRGKVLIVDDAPDTVEIIKKLLVFEGYEVLTTSTGEEGVKKVEQEKPEIVLLDISLPGIDGNEALRRIRKVDSIVSVIMLTAFATVDNAISALKEGASDFIKKPFENEHLVHLVNHCLEKYRTLKEKGRLEEEVQRLSITDDLTGLYNYRHFYKTLELEIARLKRQRTALSLLMFDMDNFKRYNDLYGHDGTYVVAGTTETSQDNPDFWLIKANSSKKIWDRKFGGKKPDEAFSVDVTQDGGFILAGRSKSFQPADFNVWLVRADPEGGELWNLTFGGSGDETAYAIKAATDGRYIMAGLVGGMGQGGDGWIIKAKDPQVIPVAYYPLDNGTAIDNSGQGANGKIEGAVNTNTTTKLKAFL